MQKQNSDFKKAKRQFKLWRKNKSHRCAVIPDELWQEAVHLCEMYPMGHVCAELGVERGRLKQKLTQLKQPVQGAGFITVDLPRLENVESTFEWIRPDGVKLRVKMPTSELSKVVASFIGGQQ